MPPHVCAMVVFLSASVTSAAAQPVMLARTQAAPVTAVWKELRDDVWEHELTHAVLAQHGLVAESARHDRSYVRSDHSTYAGH